MRFFKAKADWDAVFGAYKAHLHSIRNSLPVNARKLSALSFHDAEIKAVTHLSKRAVEIVIEGRGYDFIEKRWSGYGVHTLSFVGVKKSWVPYSIIGDYWISEEMHLSEIAAFDYQVALAKDEIRIQADDVLLTQGLCG